MADAWPESDRAELDDPFAQLTGPLASTTRLDFEVVDSARLTPHMQRLRLTAPQLDGFGYLPGQDVMLLVAAEGNRPVRRRYTIRQLDTAARLLTLDIVLHISWLHRLGMPAGDPSALAAEAAEIELPPGRGHAYLFGEATVVSRLREVLAERGLGQDQMSPKAYWGRGRANASHGEPARDA